MVVDVVVTATEGAVWAEFGGVSTRVSYGTEPPVTLDARLVDARNGDEITNEFNTTAFVCQDGRCVAQLQFILPGLEEDRITADWAVKTQWEVPRTESESSVSLEVSEPKIEPVGS